MDKTKVHIDNHISLKAPYDEADRLEQNADKINFQSTHYKKILKTLSKKSILIYRSDENYLIKGVFGYELH